MNNATFALMRRTLRLVNLLFLMLLALAPLACKRERDSLNAGHIVRSPAAEDDSNRSIPVSSNDSSSFIVYACREADGSAECIYRHVVRSLPLSAITMKSRPFYTLTEQAHLQNYNVSPTGAYVALQVSPSTYPFETEVVDLMLLSLRDGNARALTTDHAGYGPVVWSSDGTLLSYVSMAGYSEAMAPTVGGPAKHLVPWTVYVQDVKTLGRWKVFQEAPSAAMLSGIPGTYPLDWLPDIHSLIYAARRPRGLYLLAASGGKPVRLTTNVPDGFSIHSHTAYWYDRNRHVLRIAKLPATRKDVLNPRMWRHLTLLATYFLPEDVDRISFSPNGRRVALLLTPFGEDYNGLRQLVVLEIGTGLVRALGTVRGWHDEIRWLDKSDFLLADRSVAGEPRRLVAVSVDSATPRHIGTVNWRTSTAAKEVCVAEVDDPGCSRIVWVNRAKPQAVDPLSELVKNNK